MIVIWVVFQCITGSISRCYIILLRKCILGSFDFGFDDCGHLGLTKEQGLGYQQKPPKKFCSKRVSSYCFRIADRINCILRDVVDDSMWK